MPPEFESACLLNPGHLDILMNESLKVIDYFMFLLLSSSLPYLWLISAYHGFSYLKWKLRIPVPLSTKLSPYPFPLSSMEEMTFILRLIPPHVH